MEVWGGVWGYLGDMGGGLRGLGGGEGSRHVTDRPLPPPPPPRGPNAATREGGVAYSGGVAGGKRGRGQVRKGAEPRGS